MEEWRDIKGYEGRYKVSNQGRVTGIQKKFLKPAITKKGYQIVRLFDGGGRATAKDVSVHSLVADAFIGPRPTGLEINHKDCNKDNNTPSNLEYVTTKENIHHAIANGNHVLPDNSGSKNGMAVLNETKVAYLRSQLLLKKKDIKIFAQHYRVNPDYLSKVYRGMGWENVSRPHKATIPQKYCRGKQLKLLAFDDGL